jgi:hypothetical protein
MKGKGKVFPLQAFGDQEVKAPDFLDFRHCEGGKVVTLMHRPFGNYVYHQILH